MTIEVLADEVGTVHLRTIDALANAPEWLIITPGAEGAKIRATPSSHFFDGGTGRTGVGGELVDTARRYLAGAIDKATAERSIATAMTWWCKVS